MLWIQIDRSSSIPLTKQVCEQLRTKILTRELPTGERLPPTRKLAQELGVSRNVIIYVYEQLAFEGYLETREGAGTYVAQGTYLEQYKDYYTYEFHYEEGKNKRQHDEDVIDFNTGVPDLEHFPRKIWAKLLRESCLDAPDSLLDYGETQGNYRLRGSLAKFLLKTKGIRCHPDQIFILSGSAQGFLIIVHILTSPLNEIIIEDPMYLGIQRIFTHLDLPLYPVPVDEKGIQVDLIPENKPSSFVIVTPSHQFPMGSVLPIQRRVKLIEYARKTKTYIIENDYDSEFRYSGPPISSLHLLDPEYVVHVGTFSESLFPSLRIGYMILPERLIEPCRDFMRVNSMATSSLKQMALAAFIDEGHLERHINKMKKLYRKKRQILIRCLQDTFQDQIAISGDSTGLYVVVAFQNLIFSDDLMERIEEHDVRIYRVEDHAILKGRHRHKILVGYGASDAENIQEGVRRLKEALSEVDKQEYGNSCLSTFL